MSAQSAQLLACVCIAEFDLQYLCHARGCATHALYRRTHVYVRTYMHGCLLAAQRDGGCCHHGQFGADCLAFTATHFHPPIKITTGDEDLSNPRGWLFGWLQHWAGAGAEPAR